MELQSSPVTVTSTQEEDTRARWAWVEPSVWSERMLAALDNGVNGGKWFSLIDKVYQKSNLDAGKDTGMNAEIDRLASQIVKLRTELRAAAMRENPNLICELRGNGVARRGLEIAAVRADSVGFIGGEMADRLVILAAQLGVPAFSYRLCPCGKFGSRQRPCDCTPSAIRRFRARQRYRQVVAADVVVMVDDSPGAEAPTGSDSLDAAVARARDARKRLPRYAESATTRALLAAAQRDLGLAPRRLETIIQVAENIAALDGSAAVTSQHLAEAIQYSRIPGAA